jgi:hypothetical protein
MGENRKNSDHNIDHGSVQWSFVRNLGAYNTLSGPCIRFYDFPQLYILHMYVVPLNLIIVSKIIFNFII